MDTQAQRRPEAASGASGLDERAVVTRWLDVARVYFLRHAPGPEGEDLAHEAVVVLLEALRDGQVREPGRAGSFLLGVCRNLVSRRARSQQRTERALARLVEPAPAEPTAGLDARRLWECFNRLTARSRQVVARSFVQDEDSGQIGRALRMSEGNVRVVRHRALQALRECVEGRSAGELP